MRHLRLSGIIVSAAMISACDAVPTATQSAIDSRTGASPRFTVSSECGGQTDLRDSRSSFVWASRDELGATSGITSDGRGEYVGGTQGVQGKLFYHDAICSRSGDVVFDPDKNTYKPARKLTFHFPANSIGLPTTGVASGAYM